jgi:PAS domain S-box-containing protein
LSTDYENFFRLSPNLLFECTLDGRISSANPTWRRILGWTTDDLIGQNIFDFLSIDAASKVRSALYSNAEVNELPVELRSSRQGYQIFALNLEVDLNTKVMRGVAIAVWTTAVGDTNRWLLAIEATDAGFWDHDVLKKTSYHSPNWNAMLGYSSDEIPPSYESWTGLIHPDDIYVADSLESYIKGISPEFRHEYRMRTKSGKYIWILSTATAARDEQGKVTRVTGWNLDIDERKITELKLRESDMRSRAILESLPDLVFVVDIEGRYLEIHAQLPEKLIRPQSELIGRTIPEMFPAAQARVFMNAIRQSLDTRRTVTVAYELPLQDGVNHFDARICPSPHDGKVLVIVRDLTESRRTQLAIEESEKRFRDFAAQVPVLIFQFRMNADKTSQFSYANERIEEIAGVSAADLSRRGLNASLPPKIHDDEFPGLMKLVERSAMNLSKFDWEGRWIKPGGDVIWLKVVATPHREPDGATVWNGVGIDTSVEHDLLEKQRKTEKLMKEQQAIMITSSRLAALGEMAGGIAHEINNPLTIIRANSARLRDLRSLSRMTTTEIIASADKIEHTCMRISGIIAGLRAIARDGANDKFVTSSVSDILQDTLDLWAEKLRHLGIALTVVKPNEEVFLECRPIQIAQILVNLLSNAQHAVEKAGAPKWIRIEIENHPDEIDIHVIDSGSGVAAGLRERIFDPFFTTKDVGQGTGLGLSVSASIAKAHNGELFLDEERVNTTFVLRIPKSQKPVQDANQHS